MKISRIVITAMLAAALLFCLGIAQVTAADAEEGDVVFVPVAAAGKDRPDTEFIFEMTGQSEDCPKPEERIIRIKGEGRSGFRIPSVKAGKFEYDVQVSAAGMDGQDDKEQKGIAAYHVTVICTAKDTGELTSGVIIVDTGGEKCERITAYIKSEEKDNVSKKEKPSDEAENDKTENDEAENDKTAAEKGPDLRPERRAGKAKTGDDTLYALSLLVMTAAFAAAYRSSCCKRHGKQSIIRRSRKEGN